MSPIEEHLASSMVHELKQLGVHDARVTVLAGEPENWSYRVIVAGREFVLRFNPRDQLRVQETTPGDEKQFAPAEQAQVRTGTVARAEALRMLSIAVRTPGAAPRDSRIL